MIGAGLSSVRVREVLTDKVAFEKIPERCEGMSYMNTWEKSLRDSGNICAKALRQEYAWHVQRTPRTSV